VKSTFTRGNTLHAVAYDAVCGLLENRGLREWRRALVDGLEGNVLEIAAGTGLNLRHYPAEAQVFASELDPVMLARAIPRAERAAAEVDLLVADAAELPFAESSVDTVVIGLALCTIPEPVRALGEIRRVLRPRGRLRFVEHVRDEDGTLRARVQDAINPAWKFLSGGCNCNRRSVELVEASGFELEDLYRFNLGLVHTAPHVLGDAVLR
jgi:ubiquinone/menaquinone biosynthesis C-methylase UbiE